MKTVALVVPDLREEGGVKTVAAFLVDAIIYSKRYSIKVISLATAASDDCSVRLLTPSSWALGVRSCRREWSQGHYFHVGAFLSEFEFQRYRPRPLLGQLLADCDLIQVVSGSPAIGCAVAGLGKPVVLQVATRSLIERRRQATQDRGLKAGWRRRMTGITDYFDAAAVRKADAVMVENHWMEIYCRQTSRGGKTRVIYAPPGVDTSVFRPADSRRFASDESAYVLSVGRLHDERKNVFLLLHAYQELRRRHAVFPKLLLAGATSPPDAFWEQVEAFGLRDEIRFISKPSHSELIALYQGATCFALSSDEEGFGMVLIESMACGVPAVSTCCGGPEGIIEDGTDGFLIPMNDAMSLAERIEILCLDHDLNARMGLLARKKAMDQYDLAVAGGRFVSLYDDLLHTPERCVPQPLPC